ncbi:ABC transporter permease [Flexivirga aerilata]|uniref:ABC transporter permease n=1 Tax=Flexivirga aerilata TaxID=1656889 RepID=UPI001BB29228|nr:ABC transporter permease [Flexivirga aerilata]
MTSIPPHHAANPDARRGVGLVLALAIGLSALLALFAWPAVHSAPRDLPIVLSGPPAATTGVKTALEQQHPGAFDVIVVTDEAAAIQRITDHDAYGAFVVTAHNVEVLTASARSATVAQLLGQTGATIAGAHRLPTTTRDVVPAPADDPRGVGIGVSMLPIAMGAVICAAASTFLIRTRRDRTLVAAGFAIVGGFAMTALLQFWLGTLDGNYVANACVVAFGVGAVSMTILGLESLIGPAGIGVGVLLMMLTGNALSGATTAPEMLPTGWGTAGQLLPVGAANTALRSTAFFDGHGAVRPLIVVGCWLLIGLALQFAAYLRRRATDDTAAPVDAEATGGAPHHLSQHPGHQPSAV